ncbi:MAG: SIR2 family protein [Balneolaceae bacterium]
MSKKRNVYLFGAGAVIDWEGPKTPEITEVFLKSGFKCSDKETRITYRIHQELLKNGWGDSEVNFELILGVIEDLIGYYLTNQSAKSSVLRCFLRENETLIKLFPVVFPFDDEEKEILLLPNNEEYEKLNFSNNNQGKAKFLNFLLVDLITTISSHIPAYSYYSEFKKDVIEKETNQKLNNDFFEWMNKENSIKRMYTLNYDYLFKKILENRDAEVFDGFNLNDPKGNEEFEPDLYKICSDFDSNIHYNLHGSIWWRPKRNQGFGLNGAKFTKTAFTEFLSNEYHEGFPVLEIENGREIILSNIISGTNKTLRTAISPFRQMLSAFDRDCITADNLFIVGYSFSDGHLNEIINIALEENRDLNIHVIDPILESKNLDDHLPSNLKRNFYHASIAEKVFQHKMNFKDYLRNESEHS